MDIEKQVEKLTKAVEGLADQWEEIGNRTTANAVQIGLLRDEYRSLKNSLSSFTFCFIAAVPTLLRVISEKVDENDPDIIYLIDLFERTGFDWKKFVEIFKTADLKSVTVLIMEVPCCFGLQQIAEEAVKQSGLDIPFNEIVVGINGEVK